MSMTIVRRILASMVVGATIAGAAALADPPGAHASTVSVAQVTR